MGGATAPSKGGKANMIYETKHFYILYIMQKQSTSYLELIFFLWWNG